MNLPPRCSSWVVSCDTKCAGRARLFRFRWGNIFPQYQFQSAGASHDTQLDDGDRRHVFTVPTTASKLGQGQLQLVGTSSYPSIKLFQGDATRSRIPSTKWWGTLISLIGIGQLFQLAIVLNREISLQHNFSLTNRH